MKSIQVSLNKFNINLLARRLETVTTWLIENKSEVRNIPIGCFGSSTGAAAAIEGSDESSSISDKVYAIVSRRGRQMHKTLR